MRMLRNQAKQGLLDPGIHRECWVKIILMILNVVGLYPLSIRLNFIKSFNGFMVGVFNNFSYQFHLPLVENLSKEIVFTC